jgi:hypothetical protein
MMELKHALAVCLISLFSATLVMLIARTLDVQAVARIEPQLERIAEQLELLRQQGFTATAPVTEDPLWTDNELVVYYFHGTARCDTCRAIESQTHSALQSAFGEELNRGRVIWKTLNYEDSAPDVAELTKKFEIEVPMVVLARRSAGEIGSWKSLDQVWALVDDEPAFSDFVRTEVTQMLTPQ